MTIDPDRVATIIAEIAEAEIAPRFGALEDGAVRTKTGPNDFVTEADEAAEAELEKALLGIRPDAVFIGEESAAENPSIVEKLKGDGAFWIVDPLDGTRNFVRGVEEFATIVAFVEGGQTRIGWIYAIPDKACAVGVEGEGVRWRGASVEAPVPLESSVGLRSLGWLSDDWRKKISRVLKTALSTQSMHCSAYSYLKVMRGDADFTLHSKIHPWDHAAGALMLSEIGGRTAFLDDGRDYRPQPTTNRPLLAAASHSRWTEVSSVLLA